MLQASNSTETRSMQAAEAVAEPTPSASALVTSIPTTAATPTTTLATATAVNPTPMATEASPTNSTSAVAPTSSVLAAAALAALPACEVSISYSPSKPQKEPKAPVPTHYQYMAKAVLGKSSAWVSVAVGNLSVCSVAALSDGVKLSLEAAGFNMTALLELNARAQAAAAAGPPACARAARAAPARPAQPCQHGVGVGVGTEQQGAWQQCGCAEV
jgi:hypothetical protein